VSESATQEEIKKAFREKSKIMHPDKGGNAEDMVILQNAYLYIKNQIEYKDENSRPYEIIESEFKEFMEAQSQKPPPFSQIFEEAHVWLQEFNSKFKEHSVNNPDIFIDQNNDGYGDLMEESLNNQVKSDLNNINYSDLNLDLEKKPTHQFQIAA
jgi:curved DNA-binding protein CbpA